MDGNLSEAGLDETTKRRTPWLKRIPLVVGFPSAHKWFMHVKIIINPHSPGDLDLCAPLPRLHRWARLQDDAALVPLLRHAVCGEYRLTTPFMRHIGAACQTTRISCWGVPWAAPRCIEIRHEVGGVLSSSVGVVVRGRHERIAERFVCMAVRAGTAFAAR